MAENLLGLGIIGAGVAVRKLHWPVLKKIQHEVRIRGVASRNRTTAGFRSAQSGQVERIVDPCLVTAELPSDSL